MIKKTIRARETSLDLLFWLFLAGSILGVILEGVFCLLAKGHWESHVLTLIGPFNALYGFGAVLFYLIVSFLYGKGALCCSVVIAAAATVLELLCGLLLANGIGMKAWDYSNQLLNYRGIISPAFSLIWGAAGFFFYLIYGKINAAFEKIRGRGTRTVSLLLSVLLFVNLFFTAAAIVRWSNRHFDAAKSSGVGQLLDDYTPDDWMEQRFVEWSFLDKPSSDA